MLRFGIDDFLSSFHRTDLAGKIEIVRGLKRQNREIDHVGYVSEPIEEPGKRLFALDIDRWSLASSVVASQEIGVRALLYKIGDPPLELIIPQEISKFTPPPHIAYKFPDLASLQRAQNELMGQGLTPPDFMKNGPLPSRDLRVLYLDGVSEKGNRFRIELCLSTGATPIP